MTSVGASPITSDNPYISLLYDAVRAEGVSVEAADLRPWRLRSAEQHFDALHVHWPEYIMMSPSTGFTRTARVIAAALAFRTSVRRLRSQGVRIVWTAHNSRPHNPDAPRQQVELYRWLAHEADAVIVHTPYAGGLVRRQMGRSGPIYLARHGHYMGVYAQANLDRALLRSTYGLGESDRALLAFGQIRAYKRLVELVDEFEALARPLTHLIIAGAPKDRPVGQHLKAAAARNARIHLLDRHIPDAEVSALYTLADLAVFNYAEMFSSGALMLAFSLGLAVLAPRKGTEDELIDKPALFAWNDSPFEVLDEALAVPAHARQAAALASARSHGWADSARIHIQAYTGGPPNLT